MFRRIVAARRNFASVGELLATWEGAASDLISTRVEPAKGHSLIYGVSGLPVLDPDESRDPFAIEEVAIYRPRHIDARIAAQRGVFTVHPQPTLPLVHPGLRKWTVSQDACRDLKIILDSCAVNYATMFPDLEGLARHVGWRYKWGMGQGNVIRRDPDPRTP